MNYLIAKLRMKGNDCKYRKILATNKMVYPAYTDIVTSSSPYSPDNQVLDDGEWYTIGACSDWIFALDIMKEEMESVDFASLTSEEYKNIDFLFTMDGEALFFQNVGKSRLVSKKGIMCFGEKYEYHDNCKEIIINEKPDAIYIKATDSLYFRNLSSITGIFKGIDQLYREATEEETSSFLNEDFICLTDGFAVEKVKTANRKRIAVAKDILNRLSAGDRSQIFSYIGDYCPDLKTPDNTFKVGSEDQLKMVLYGIEQRFYTTPVGGEKRIANSVIALSDLPTGN